MPQGSTQYPVTTQVRRQLRANGVDLTGNFPLASQALAQVAELEHQGMEPGAYSVTMEQYGEVIADFVTAIYHGGN